MMVVAVSDGLVVAAYVDDCVACGEHGGVASTDEAAEIVGGELAEHVDGEGFVGVEVAAGCSQYGAGALECGDLGNTYGCR